MPDPLEVLRTAIPLHAPDPAFARQLRAQLVAALSLPTGVTMTNDSLPTGQLDTSAETASTAVSLIPYLAVHDARAAIDWYAEALGAEVVGEPIVMQDGRIGHCELRIEGGLIYLADQAPEIGVVAPERGKAAVSLVLAVADADAALARVERAGGTRDREPYEGHGSRNAWMVDPFAHRWLLQGPLSSGSPRTMRRGDVGYVSWWCPDAARAARFYSTVLGWEVAGEGAHRRVTGQALPIGVQGGHETSTLFCCYAVDDLAEGLAAVQSAGGAVVQGDGEEGTVVCTDDQGMVFALYEPSPGEARPPVDGRGRAGDLAYVTHEVADTARARSLLAGVLGWRFEPGRVADGWGVVDTAPMTGLVGSTAWVGVPMWMVDDVADAARRVRELGGDATEPEPQPYGLLLSQCTDDQGGRFYLGGQ